MTDASKGEAAPRFGRVAAIALIIALVLELAARFAVYLFAGEAFSSLSLYKWSPYGLVRNNPELTSPRFKIERNGLRSRVAYEKAKPPGAFRVLLLGGSVLYSGLGGIARLEKYGRVDSADTIAPFLEAALKNDERFASLKIEVINAAVNFNRIVEISTAYLEEYNNWDADFVIVFGAVNNFSTPRFAGEFRAGRTDLQKWHPWRADFERLVNERSLAAFVERSWRAGAEHSAALALAQKGFAAIADRLAALSEFRFQRAPVPFPPIALEGDAERADYMRFYQTYADAIIAACRREGRGVAFVWEPMLSDVEGVKPLSDEERSIIDGVRRAPWAIEQYEATRRAFHAIFDAEQVPVVDPTEALRDHRDTVFIDYGHYTPAGNAFVAGVVHRTLQEPLRRQAGR